MMNLRDLLSGFFWLVISIFVCMESIRMNIGAFHSPGPGFLPFWSSVILGTFAILLLVTSRPKKKRKENITDLGKSLEWNKVVWVLLSLFLYVPLLPIMGYLITTFGLMIFLLGIMGRPKVWIQGGSAFVIVLVSYMIFCVLLDIKLPRGIFGF